MDPPRRRRGHHRHHQIRRRVAWAMWCSSNCRQSGSIAAGRRSRRGGGVPSRRPAISTRLRGHGNGKAANKRAAKPRHIEGVNEDPEGEGWFFKIKLSDKSEFAKLMDAAAYAKVSWGKSAVMRYLPLTPNDRRAMLAKIGVADVDALLRDVPQIGADPAFDLRSRRADTQGELEVERAHVNPSGGQEYRGGRGALLLRRGRLQAPRPGRGGPPDPALRNFSPAARPISRKSPGARCNICSNSRPRWRC